MFIAFDLHVHFLFVSPYAHACKKYKLDITTHARELRIPQLAILFLAAMCVWFSFFLFLYIFIGLLECFASDRTHRSDLFPRTTTTPPGGGVFYPPKHSTNISYHTFSPDKRKRVKKYVGVLSFFYVRTTQTNYAKRRNQTLQPDATTGSNKRNRSCNTIRAEASKKHVPKHLCYHLFALVFVVGCVVLASKTKQKQFLFAILRARTHTQLPYYNIPAIIYCYMRFLFCNCFSLY